MSYASRVVLRLPLSNENLLAAFVEQCLRDRVTLIAVMGEGAARIEDIIDELVVGDGANERRFVVTTSHANETLREVLEFAGFWNDERDRPVQIVNL
jgi:tRNA A22 N-methylase